MRKEDLISDIIYLLMAGIVLLVGFLVIQPAINDGLLGANTGENILFILVALVVGIVINVILMELGHIIGALIGGYKILSFNILGLNFYKEFSENPAKGQLKFRFKGFNGLTGETIIEPKKEKANPMFYVFFPLILFLLEFVAMYFAIQLIPASASSHFEPVQIVKYGLVVSTTIAGCIVLYDYFPAKLDTLNDGYRLISLLRNKINIEAYNEKLKLEANEYKGIKNTEYKIFEEITDFTARINLETALKKVNEKAFDEALSIIDSCLAKPEKISHSTKTDLLLNKVFISFLSKGKDAGLALYKELDDETKEAVKKCKSLVGIRVYALYIAFDQKSKSEVKYAINKAKKMYDRLTIGEIDKEMSLVSDTLKLIMDFDSSLVDGEVIKDACYGKTDNHFYKELIDYSLKNKKEEVKEEKTNKEEDTTISKEEK